MEERTRRLQILDEAEVAALFELPSFNDEQRAVYFSLSAQEELLLSSLHSVKSRCHFILQLGYFKYSYQFFIFSPDEAQKDMRYVQTRYFPHERLSDVEVTKVTRLKQQKLILGLFNFRTCDARDRRVLLARAEQAARISTKPLYIFRELMEHLNRERRVSPAYTSMQDIVGRALGLENGRLVQVLKERLEQSLSKRWDTLETEWRLQREVDLIPLPGSVIIPDFRLVHPDGRSYVFEIVGYWRPEYLRKKFMQVAKSGRNDLILAVSERLNLEGAGVDVSKTPAKVLWFKGKIEPKEVLEL